MLVTMVSISIQTIKNVMVLINALTDITIMIIMRIKFVKLVHLTAKFVLILTNVKIAMMIFISIKLVKNAMPQETARLVFIARMETQKHVSRVNPIARNVQMIKNV
jgi:hypothetical protein